MWDANKGECLGTLTKHTDQVRCVITIPGGQYFVSGSTDKTMMVWS